MQSTRSIRERAHKQLALLKSVEALGTNVSQKMVADFQARAMKALSSGGKIKVTKAERAGMLSELADLMLLGFVRRYRQEKSALGLQLSFTSDVARLAKGLDLDLDGIHSKFEANARKRVNGAVGFLESKINDELKIITARQQTTRVATRELRRRLDEMGVSPTNPSIAETLVRTHAQLAFGAAQYKLDQSDEEGIITGYVYSTVGDDRVREEHAAMEGVIFAIDDPRLDIWWPPNGWNCRCQLVALTDPIEATKTPRGVEPDDGFAFNPGQLAA